MNKKIIAITLLTITLCSTHASDSHAFIQSLSAIKQPLWQHTTLPASNDPALELTPTLATLPGLPATSTLFFSRTPVVAHLSDLLDNNAPFFAPYEKHIDAVTVQEHTLGMQLGQQWQQDHWEVAWQWWLGIRERNAWLAQTHRRALRALIDDKTLSHRTVNPWHASAVHAGIGDVHLTARYLLPLGALGKLGLGLHVLVPTATKQQRKTAEDEKNSLPVTTDPFLKRLTARARDILLCAPFGTNGHAGMGLSATLKLNMGGNFSLCAEATSIRFRPGTQRRYGLNELKKTPTLYAGDLEIWSDDAEVTEYAHTYVYPREQEVKLTPGALHCASTLLAYTVPAGHLAVGYRYQFQEDEEAEQAHTSLLRSSTEQHQISLAGSAKNSHDWGESSSYLTASYTFAGTHQGTWSIGFGATVQA